jgi:hypothetical protein
MAERFDGTVAEDPEARLERALMEEFLRRQHHSFDDLSTVAPGERRRLLEGAAEYASRRLAEIGARAHYVEDLHRHE